MTLRFAEILQGLLANHGLSPRAVSRASGRAESTILQLLHGRIPPSVEIVTDIAPVLQISEADLLTIAGLATTPATGPIRGYHNPAEIGELVSIASSLPDGRLQQLMGFARNLKTEGDN